MKKVKVGKGLRGRSFRSVIGCLQLEITGSMMNKTLKEIVAGLAKSHQVEDGEIELDGIAYVPRWRN